MFNRLSILSVFLMPLALSCSRVAPEIEENQNETTISARIVTTVNDGKTWLDSEAQGSVIPLYWSDGDRVNVNGQTSSAISVPEGEKKSTADFSLRSVTAPFKMIYPASIVGSGAYYDEEGNIDVDLSTTQAYSATSFGTGAAVMCGYSEDEAIPVTLHNMCAAVRVRIVNAQGQSNVIAGVKITSRGRGICGHFVANPSAGTLVAANDATPTIQLEMPSVTVGSAGSWFWLSVPAGEYPEGFDLFFTRESDRRVMQCAWTSTKTLESGKVYTFDNVIYVPGAKDIETSADWEEFADAYNSGSDISKYLYSDGFVRLGADISAENLTRIDNFKDKFDGQGYTLTRTAAKNSLFRGVAGEVRNVVFAGSWDTESNYQKASAAVDTLRPGGLVSSCTNNMTINLTKKDTYHIIGGLVRIVNGGTIENCVNNGALSASPDCSETDITNFNIGGIAAQVAATAKEVKITGCRNNGKITVDPIATSGTFGIKFNAVGGIVGWMRNSELAVIEKCDNAGEIEYKGDKIADNEKAVTAYAACVGGIVGNAAYVSTSSGSFSKISDENGVLVQIKSCRNTATIRNNFVNYTESKNSGKKVYTGGIAGALMGFISNRSSVTDSKNTGTIIPYDIVGGSQRAGYSSVASGFVGFGGNVDFVRDTINCEIGNGKRPSVSMGGLFGYTIGPFSLSYSIIHYNGYWTRLTAYKLNRAAIAVVPVKAGSSSMSITPEITGSVVENCFIGARPYSSTTTMSDAKDVSDQSSKLTIQLSLLSDENAVCGESYSTLAKDVKFTNVIYTY